MRRQCYQPESAAGRWGADTRRSPRPLSDYFQQEANLPSQDNQFPELAMFSSASGLLLSLLPEMPSPPSRFVEQCLPNRYPSEKLPSASPTSWSTWHPTVGPTVLVLTRGKEAHHSAGALSQPRLSHELPSNTLSSCKTNPRALARAVPAPGCAAAFSLRDLALSLLSLLSL